MKEDPELYEGSENRWFVREVNGRSYLLNVSFLLTKVIDTLGCHLYDLEAEAPIDPALVTTLLDHPISHTSAGGDPAHAVDQALLVTTVWGPSPRFPRTLDTYLTFIPKGSKVADQTGFTGLALVFQTSLPNRDEFQSPK